MTVSMSECTGATLESTGGNQGAYGNWQLVNVLRPEILVTKLGVKCQAVTVTIYDLHHLNRLLCYNISKVTYLFG